MDGSLSRDRGCDPRSRDHLDKNINIVRFHTMREGHGLLNLADPLVEVASARGSVRTAWPRQALGETSFCRGSPEEDYFIFPVILTVFLPYIIVIQNYKLITILNNE